MLWDWGSVDSVSKWSIGFFWAGIAFLILLALAEIASHILSSRKDTLIAQREQAAAESERQAREDFQAELAAFGKSAEEARQAAERVQQQQTDRKLSAQQRTTLVKQLSGFAGQEVSVVCIMGDGEAQQFAEQFVDVFSSAGWRPEGVSQKIFTETNPVGIEVTINQQDAKSGKTPPAADALVHTLINLGLMRRQETKTPPRKRLEVDIGIRGPQIPAGAIEFRVGRKSPT